MPPASPRRQKHFRPLLPLLLILATIAVVHSFIPSLPSAASGSHARHRAARLPSPLSAAPAPVEDEPSYASLIFNDLLLLFDRALDTVEDIGVHLRRATERDLDRRFRKDRLSVKRGDKPRVLILGTGWGGHAVAKVIDTGKCVCVYVYVFMCVYGYACVRDHLDVYEVNISYLLLFIAARGRTSGCRNT